MRAKAALVLLVAAGAVWAAHGFVGDWSLRQGELDRIRAECPECHGEVPAYDRVAKVHRRHAAFDCGRCHLGAGGFETTAGVHKGLAWAGTGVFVFVLAGIAANLLTVRKRTRGT